MEPKYVSLDEVVNVELSLKDRLAPHLKSRKTGQKTAAHWNELYKYMTGTHVDCRNGRFNDPIITEDIECEIIEPKKLPLCE